MPEPNVRHVPKSAWTLLPPPPDACQVCATKHTPEQPHNAQSLFWATAREIAGEPPPTWELALAHCSPEVRDAWVQKLAEIGGVVIDVAEVERLGKELKT